MVLDSSDISRDDTTDDHLQRILSVPEYADDVYTYLRELEVYFADET